MPKAGTQADGDDAGVSESNGIIRVPTLEPLTQQQLRVAEFLSRGMTQDEVVSVMGIAPTTVEYYTVEAARKIVATGLSRTAKIVVWYRGATVEVLGARPNPLREALLKARETRR